MSEQFHQHAAAFALKDMFEGKHFSICTIDSIEELGLSKLNSKDKAALRLLHCKNWADMPPELRQMTFAKVVEGVSNGKPEFNMELLSAAMGSPKITRLIGDGSK